MLDSGMLRDDNEDHTTHSRFMEICLIRARNARSLRFFADVTVDQRPQDGSDDRREPEQP